MRRSKGIIPANALGITTVIMMTVLAARASAGPCVPVPALDDRCEAWAAQHGNPSDLEQPRATAAGGGLVFVAGTRSGAGANYLTLAYDSTTGTERWAAEFDGGGTEVVSDVTSTADGSRVFVTGATAGGVDGDVMTLAYEGATGQAAWQTRWSESRMDGAGSIALSPNEDVLYVQVTAVEESTGADILAVVALDAATGAELWTGRLVVPDLHSASGLAVDPQGERVYLAATVGGADGLGANYLAAALAAAAQGSATPGQLLWSTSYDGGAEGRDDRVAAIATAPDGSRVFLTGESARAVGSVTAYEYATLALDPATGATQWVARYRASDGSAYATAIGVDPAGARVYVTGRAKSSSTADGFQTGFHYATVAYDAATGEQRWAMPYDHPGTSEWGTSLAVSSNGERVYVSGWSAVYPFPDANIHVATLAYDASTGASSWVARYNTSDAGLDRGRPWDMAASGGRVFVVVGAKRYSSGAPLGNDDFATLAYDA